MQKALEMNDCIAGISFDGSDGTKYTTGATIVAHIGGSVGVDCLPTSLEFLTRGDTGQRERRISITQDGHLIPTFDNRYHCGLSTHRWLSLSAHRAYFTHLQMEGQLFCAADKKGVGAWNHAGPQVSLSSNTHNVMHLNHFGDRAGCYQLSFSKTRGESGTDHKACLDNDALGGIDFSVSSGTKYLPAGFKRIQKAILRTHNVLADLILPPGVKVTILWSTGFE